MHYWKVIDANISRCSEGLRVLEDLHRFESPNPAIVHACKKLRTALKEWVDTIPYQECINARHTTNDPRACDRPPLRHTMHDIITANIKRCTEACRVLEECTNKKSISTLRYQLYELEQTIYAAMQTLTLKGPGIYVISDNPDHLIQCAKEPFVPIVQYRDKSASKSTIYQISQYLADQLKSLPVSFIVNDFVDIAISVDADGVHLGQDDLPTPMIRSQFGHTKIIGRTTHAIDQGLMEQEHGASYISVGPIWETPSKPGRPGIGFDYLDNHDQLTIPFVAIGGINPSNIHHILPYKPPLVGAIRATHQDLHALWDCINTPPT